MIEQCVSRTELGYMDAIVHLCEKNNIEIEDIKKFISPVIKGKIEVEAQKINYIKKGNSLTLE